MSPLRRFALVVLGASLLAGPAAAGGFPEKGARGEPARAGARGGETGRPDAGGAGIERAREESAVRRRPPGTYALPAGELRITPSELLASAAGQTIRFTVQLDRPVPGGTLSVRLPRRWLQHRPGGLPTTRSLHRLAGTNALDRSGRSVDLTIEHGRDGDTAGFELTDIGIPAGTYRLPFAWRTAGGAVSGAGTSTVVLYAPSREGPETDPGQRLANPGIAENASADANEESETFIATTQGNTDRLAAGSNWQSASMPAWISGDAGHTWVQRTMPQTIDAPAKAVSEAGSVCCDPTFAADGLGNIWFGGLALSNGPLAPSRVVVNRIAAGTTGFQAQTTGLKTRTPGTQDKPMMTIDNSPSSTTFGRIYVVWDEPDSGGGVNLVIVQCDTRPGGSPDAAHCDNADNWSAPVSVTPSTGSYIYGDVAVGPDGRVYVTWWDYSSTNAIRGDVCDPSTQNCAAASGWGTPQTIATLDATGGKPVPFACPILAQPGGRAAPDPQVEVDHSGGFENGRVYVTWGDLRPGSGTTRCAVKMNGSGTTPASTHLTFDSFVASAASGALPGSANPSASVGTRLYTDGEGGGAANSDDWFAWLAVDQTSGQAWADFYSTRDDTTRRTTNFYARSVTPSGGGHTLGTLTKVSAAASNYSNNTCCKFGNDYGDYTGIDATSGLAYPVWTDNSGGDGEVFTFVTQPPGSPPTATTSPATSIGQTTATLNGSVNPQGQSTTYHFEYGTSISYGTNTSSQSAGSGNSAQAVSASLASLSPGTTYHFRLVAENPSGTTDGSDATFTTASPPSPPPTVVTGAATAIDQNTATLNGSVNPNSQSTTYDFEYGVDAGGSTVYSSTPIQSAGSGSAAVSVSADLAGLTAGTTYRFRLTASNPSGPATGAELTFKTSAPPPPPPPPPVALTGVADQVGTATATLHGSVDPNGQPTTYHFDYGTSVAYGLATGELAAGSDHTSHPVSAGLFFLNPGTTYHYRLVATSAGGTTAGLDHTLTTVAIDTTGPLVAISDAPVRLTDGGAARVRVRCPAAEPDPTCHGRLRLKSARAVSFSGGFRRIALGSHEFEIGSGSARRVRVPLPANRQALLARLGRLRVKATARGRDLAGNLGVSRRRFTLIAP